MKNRQRQAPTFANINLLGKCNVNCFFCLGKDYTDGTINKDYFVVEGWEKQNGLYDPNKDEGSLQNNVTILDM